jgi:peroxiredoxin Q/BCP
MMDAMTMKHGRILTLMFSFLTAFSLRAMPQAGDVAPAFEGFDQNTNTVKLADFAGKKNVLLYFYPKDFTGGCTKEACGFRDRMGDLAQANVAVIGVSHDSIASHSKFAEKYDLKFPLIADPSGEIIKAYGVKMAVLSMASRVSFLIGTDGKIIHVTDSLNPQKHFDEMHAAIAALKK